MRYELYSEQLCLITNVVKDPQHEEPVCCVLRDHGERNNLTKESNGGAEVIQGRFNARIHMSHCAKPDDIDVEIGVTSISRSGEESTVDMNDFVLKILTQRVDSEVRLDKDLFRERAKSNARIEESEIVLLVTGG